MRGTLQQVMERLAVMPLLDRIEIAAVCGISERAAYNAAAALLDDGLAAALPHASEMISPTKRLLLTAKGLHRLAVENDVPVETLLHAHPVSAQWRRILLERLDAVACILRITASVAAASGPVRGFRWFRAAPLDAALLLDDGRAVGIVRQGPASARTAFARRLLRLQRGPLPAALLVLASDPSRLEHAARLLDGSLPPVFLAVDAAAVRAGAFLPAWRTPSNEETISLRTALARVAPEGELPEEEQHVRAAMPEDMVIDGQEKGLPDHLLPARLSPTEKRALELLAAWPWLAPAHLGALLGVHPPRLSQVTGRLQRLGLALAHVAAGRRRFTLTDRGIALLARRDRASAAEAVGRWSANPVDPRDPLTWRNVSGARSRQLLRNVGHTEAVHAFVAALAAQTRTRGLDLDLDLDLDQLDPPHRAARFFRHDGRLHSVRPDASGVVRRGRRQWSFFLEWERRAVRPVTMAARIAPYLRYFSALQPTLGHGPQPSVLVVFDDELTAVHFLRIARREMARSRVHVPLRVSHARLLEEHGPLGPAWRTPGGSEPAHAFPYEA